MAQPAPDPASDRDVFAAHVTALFRAGGVTGGIEHDPDAEKLRVGARTFDLARAFETYRSLPPHQRDDVLGKYVRLSLRTPVMPATWAEAKDHLLPMVWPRLRAVLTDLRREPANPIPRHALTEHLVVEVGFPIPDGTVSVDRGMIDRWGVSMDEVGAQAAQNLARRGARPWRTSPKFPGVFRSGWGDGYDVSRLLLPEVFARIEPPLRGDPVMIASTPGTLLVAGADDARGLVGLAQAGRELFEKDRFIHFFRPLRLHDGTWTHWLPPAGHAAYAPLALLQAYNRQGEYTQQARALQALAVEKGLDTPAMPPVSVHPDGPTQDPVLVATWRQGRPTALPEVDAVVLVRGAKTLGVVAWADLLRVLPGELRPIPGYPPRWLAHTFPEAWQLGALSIEPWDGPLP